MHSQSEMEFHDNSLQTITNRRKRKNTDASASIDRVQKKNKRERQLDIIRSIDHSNCAIGVNNVNSKDLKNVEDILSKPSDIAEAANMASQHMRDLASQELDKKMENRSSWHEDAEKLFTTSQSEEILSLPHRLHTVLSVDGQELIPLKYEKLHVWLCLQWKINGEDNVFFSRPCASEPCLGKYISHSQSGEKKHDFRLPEMVPLATLNSYRQHLSLGYTAKSWKQEIMKKRQSHITENLRYPLARDIWTAPICVLCLMHKISSFALNSEHVRKMLSLGEYQRFFVYQFPGMSPQFQFSCSELNTEIEIEESHVFIPRMSIPFTANILQNIQMIGEWEGVDIDRLYK